MLPFPLTTTAAVGSTTSQPPTGILRGAFNINNMPSTGSGAMFSRKDVADVVDDEDEDDDDDEDLFDAQSLKALRNLGNSKNKKKKRVEIAPAPPNELVVNSIWDGTAFDGNAMDAIKQSFCTEATKKYSATLGKNHTVKETGGVNNKNGLVITCATDGKSPWEKRLCDFGLKSKLLVKKSLSKAQIMYCCLVHSEFCEV